MPLPGTTVVHPDFEAHHRPVSESAMTVGVVITRGGSAGEFDPVTGTGGAGTRSTIASCAARIQATRAQDRTVAAGEQVITLRTYLVVVPIAVEGVLVDDRVEVTSVLDDTDGDLLGTLLRVRDVVRGSIVWERDLVCEEDLG